MFLRLILSIERAFYINYYTELAIRYTYNYETIKKYKK